MNTRNGFGSNYNLLWNISLNYTLTQFKLDNKEATVSILFIYVVTLSVVCTLKRYNTKNQRNVWNCVEGVERSLYSFNCYSCYSCRKGQKVVFVAFMQHCTQSNITHLTHVESVFSIKWCLAPPKYSVRTHNIFTHNFLNIQWICKLEKVLESWDLGLSNSYVCRSMSKGSKVILTFDSFDIASTHIKYSGMVGKP